MILTNVLYHQWILMKVYNEANKGVHSFQNVAEGYMFNKDSMSDLQSKKQTAVEKKVQIHSFFFDPNLLSGDSLQLLGINHFAVRNLLKYREKGGIFYKPEDLNKIYGLKNEEFERLKPLILIEKTIFQNHFNTENRLTEKIVPTEQFTAKIQINTADEFLFSKLVGIGDVLSERIVKYRSSLGGFYRVDQINEVYGIEDSLFARIKPYLVLDPRTIVKIKINDVSFKNLIKHPYADYDMTRALINYRNMHGAINDAEELKRIYSLDRGKMAILLPYLDFTREIDLNDPGDLKVDSLRLNDTISQSQ
jgi:competence ComEA-like helix-hairpin-helix protein